MKAYKSLVKFAIAHNCSVSVFDGEAWVLKRSTGVREIFSTIESVDVAELRFRNIAGEIVGHALVTCDCSASPEETVIDGSGDVFNKWFDLTM